MVRYGCDVAYTPMIIADTFNRSAKARDSEFSSCSDDHPLIVQFGAKDPIEFALAAKKCEGYAEAVDLNCGCPQRWAIQQGIGASLISDPQLIREMVTETKKISSIPITVKVRIKSDLRETIDLIQQVEQAGPEWITVHGRTVRERRQHGVHYDVIRQIKEIAKVPIMANGDLFKPADIVEVVRSTNVDGVMCARGLLANPALFAGYEIAPIHAITGYYEMALKYGGLFHLHHSHLMFMLHPQLVRSDRLEFCRLKSMEGVRDFFIARNWIQSSHQNDLHDLFSPLQSIE